MLDAGLLLVQVSEDVKIQETKSPFNGVYVKNWLFVPELMPFTFHWYEGVNPPKIGYAVKVTVEPAQTVSASGEMVMLTGKFRFTIMTIEFEVAGLFEMQTVNEDVSTQVTIS